MTSTTHLQLAEIEQKVCDVTAAQLGIPRHKVFPSSRLVQDLEIDSLDLVELMMELEESFAVTLPDDSPSPVYKSVFTRNPFRLSDVAELIYLQQGTGAPGRHGWRNALSKLPSTSVVPFSQLDGCWEEPIGRKWQLLEALPSKGSAKQYRRRTDGMRCIFIPEANVEIGSDAAVAEQDERPRHVVRIEPFNIDAEPVSTTAFCRFLNSIGPVTEEVLSDWFLLSEHDDRQRHLLVERIDNAWRPTRGAERWPMILVSWFGANAYSLWANSKNWSNYADQAGFEQGSFLPTEAQWEYAARGPRSCEFPWGDAPPSQDKMRFAQHRRSLVHCDGVLPLADVNATLGMSPFGLHHMAGNVWQWCRDWYDASFYATPEAKRANPLNRIPTQIRSERGGSWVGPAELCRSSHRRGRPPHARGRCLGFRCVTPVTGRDTV